MDSVFASEVEARAIKSNYPEPFATRVSGKIKKPLGDFFGIKKFGVNLTELSGNSEATLLHKHSKQEEFIYVISGNPTLICGNTETQLQPGMCAGFTPLGKPHRLVNRSATPAIYIEIGDRVEGDEVSYPEDDLVAVSKENKWRFEHKDGRSY